MLFLLTGDIQTGKTRWLQRLLTELQDSGVKSCGVIAPGVWTESLNYATGASKYEKLGIDNVLLPEGNVVPFARRVDLAIQENVYDRQSQSAKANLAWAIDDNAITSVNTHLETIANRVTKDEVAEPSLFVVDELGQLELVMGKGLMSAISILERGAVPSLPHALAVVRSQLLAIAQERFSPGRWNGTRAIRPDDEGRQAVIGAFRQNRP